MKNHDKIYTVILIVMAFWSFISVGVMKMSLMESRAVELIMLIYSALFVLTLVTVMLRLWKPTIGRIVSLAVNIILLPAFPIGTAIGIYGLWKVDKQRNGNTQPGQAC